MPFTIQDDEWGRYLIYIKDLDSGHATGGTVYVDWPAYRGRSDRSDPDAPAMLSFSLDKRSYKAGETATVYIPSAENGRALVSIENGSEVMSSEWVKTSGTDTAYKIRITDDMAPNFYVHITLVQPYRNSSNDLPVRMYGVQPVMVENPDSHLNPVITMADKVHPEEPFTIKVSEKDGKPMTYTLAIVDEDFWISRHLGLRIRGTRCTREKLWASALGTFTTTYSAIQAVRCQQCSASAEICRC